MLNRVKRKDTKSAICWNVRLVSDFGNEISADNQQGSRNWPLRDYTLNVINATVNYEDIVRPLWRHKEASRNISSPKKFGHYQKNFNWEVTEMSEMPCRFIDGLHEWRNEISTVPSWKPLNILYWCKGQWIPVGSEDPVKLYCNLLLRCDFCCIAYVGDAKA